MNTRYLVKHSLKLLAFLSLGVTQYGEASQLIIHGGVFYNDSGKLSKDAILVSDGVIRGIGKYDKMALLAGNNFVYLDTRGKLLLPGLIDSHVHTAFAGFQKTAINFPQEILLKSELEERVNLIKGNKKAFYGDVLVLMNTPLEYWSDLGKLDSVFNSTSFASIPVVLAGSDAHTGWINSEMEKVFQRSQKINSYPEEVQKQFKKDIDGRFTGFVSEKAWDVVTSSIPTVSQERIEASIIAGACELNSYGITAWMDPIINVKPLSPIFGINTTRNDLGLLPSYISASKSGRLHGKVTGLFLVNQNAGSEIIKEVTYVQSKFNASTPNIQLKGIKILQDGVIEPPSQTARLSSDYLNRPGYSGDYVGNHDNYHAMIAEADRVGLIVHAHAIGDRAVNEFLNAIEYTRRNNNNVKMLHSITHLEIMESRDIKRLKHLNVAAVMQPLWAGASPSNTSDLEGVVKPELLENLYPMGSILRSGAVMTGSSDWPVSTPNPYLAMYTAMTRKGPSGVLQPSKEKVQNVNQMIDAYTINAAKAIGRDNEIGSITVGKRADLTLLNKDITTSESNLDTASVEWTMIDGEIIFNKGKCK